MQHIEQVSIPITILTGFLGAGKTTLLNHALRQPLLKNALVVVNEIGDVPLDHLLVREVREDVLVLDSGCVCCSVRGDLVKTLLTGISRTSRRFDRVLVETTGFADPTPILATLVRHPELTQHFHLDAVITAVDAVHGLATLAKHPEATKQLLLADDVVITKADCVEVARLAELRSELHKLHARARVFTATRGELDWQVVLAWTPSTVAARLDVGAAARPHEAGPARTFTVRAHHPIDFRSFALWLSMVSQFHGESLLRVKGLLHVPGEPGPVVVQAVQHVVYPTYIMPAWPSEDTSSRVVVITRGMDPQLAAELQSSLEAVFDGAPATTPAP